MRNRMESRTLRYKWIGQFGFLLILLVIASLASNYVGVTNSLIAQEETLDPSLEGPSPTSSGPRTSGSPSPDGSENVFDMLRDMGATGVLFLIVFFLMSLAMVFFIIEHTLTIRKGKLMPDVVVAELEQKIARGEINDAIEFCHLPENYCLASEVVLAGLERYVGSEFGFAEYKTAVEEEGEDQTGRLYRKTEVLGVIGSIAPMLGLTGTVVGMIFAFNKIASSSGAAKPEELAGGIGTALVTTLIGLLIAIPAMIAFSFFRNKIDSLVAETGKRVERLMMPLGRKR